MKPLDPRLLRYIRAARRYIIFLAGTGMLIAGLIVAQCLLIAHAAGSLIDGETDLAPILPLIGALLCVFAARIVLTYLQEAFGHRAALRVMADLRTRVLRHAGDLGPRWLANGRTSPTVTLVTDALEDLEPYFVKYLPQLILSVTVTPFTLLVILCTDWVSALAIVVCIPLIPLFMVLVGRMTKTFSDSRLAAMQRLGEQLLDLLAGLSTLKALGREQGPRRRVQELGDDYAAKTMRTLSVAFLSGAVLEFLTTLSTALVAVEVGLRMVAGHLGLAAGLAIIMLTPEVFKPLREVGSQFHASADGVAATEQAFTLLDESAPTASGPRPAPDLQQATITISALSVHSPERDTIAPYRMDASIHPGEVVALRGPSGAGKSTAVLALLQLLEPTHGSITVAGAPLAEIDQASWWSQITWVPQRPTLVPGTVLENLQTGIGEELDAAAALTGFDRVITTLPNGWHTRIGQGGTGLSLGQRQRLALTRALVAARPLVILDEPSAHLDALSEELVCQAVRTLRASGHTVLVIAHRNAIIREADRVVDVASGVAR
ncbi:thiol reductant ABC exporter subunit CydD [Actinobaculum sp. 313]|uniref:thiol reductant ABC exporter subunit CydD n=1 Tax=Actinobaculum sp. 313 TaxID=2495645 RepID=UPI000D5298C7|nr:thiol reductant ABC exporter subunit CydD [Actinobaculum sp. 313]AWE42220.1 thiol reductant ABC exporter subunit CydD [Actinobaculum sp. 313]